MKKFKKSIITTGALAIIMTSQAQEVNFVTVPGNEEVESFEMSETEITYAQYCTFLNEAYAAEFITYDAEMDMVYNTDGVQMIYLGGTRVVKDHNGDGTYALDEMENPLNRCFIAFNPTEELFYIVDPASVDWNIYFDETLFPNVVDNINDWAELNDAGTGFYGEGDTDKLLPTLEEVKTWPVNFIRYYGAEGYADFYGYELPTKTQWRYAGKAGADNLHATSDGSATAGIAWFNVDAPFEIHKGHVQPALSKAANAYGLYNLGGSVWEWVKDWYDGTTVFGGPEKLDEDYFIDEDLSFADANGNYLKGLLGGSFNFFAATMENHWNHAANMQAGNDHFGFRVCRPATSSIRSEEQITPNNIYPNPARNFIHIETKSNTAISVFRLNGELVYQDKLDGDCTLPTQDWEAGTYIIHIGDQIEKLIIQ